MICLLEKIAHDNALEVNPSLERKMIPMTTETNHSSRSFHPIHFLMQHRASLSYNRTCSKIELQQKQKKNKTCHAISVTSN